MFSIAGISLVFGKGVQWEKSKNPFGCTSPGGFKLNSRLFWLNSACPAFIPLNTDVNGVGAHVLCFGTCHEAGVGQRCLARHDGCLYPLHVPAAHT